MVISRPKIWRKVNFCIFLMLESNFWIHWIFFLIFKPYLSQICKIRESVWTIFEVLLVCLTDEERHLNPIISHHYYLGFGYTTPTSSYSIFKVYFLQSCSNKSFVRYKAKNWFDMALTLSNSIDFYHDIEPCSIPSFCGK